MDRSTWAHCRRGRDEGPVRRPVGPVATVCPERPLPLIYWAMQLASVRLPAFAAASVLPFCRPSVSSSLWSHILIIPGAWRKVDFVSDPAWKILRKSFDSCTLGHPHPTPGPRPSPWGREGGQWREVYQNDGREGGKKSLRCPLLQPPLTEETRPTL